MHHADLAWSGGNTAEIDIYRDQQLVATVPNSGSYTDNIGTKGGASYSYDVCESGTTTCPNAVALNTSISPEAGTGDILTANATESGSSEITAGGGGGGSISASLLLFIGLSVFSFGPMSRCINRRRKYHPAR